MIEPTRPCMLKKILIESDGKTILRRRAGGVFHTGWILELMIGQMINEGGGEYVFWNFQFVNCVLGPFIILK